MHADEPKLEELLRGLRPAALDAALLERLERAATGGLQQEDLAAAGVQAKLREMVPARPRQELLERLGAAVEGVPFPVDEKVVLFPRGGAATPPAGRRSHRPWLAAAACVALLGALSAFLVTPRSVDTPLAAKQENPGRKAPTVRVDPGAFVPAAYGSDLSDTRDLGVHWSGERRPVRVMRVIYRDRVSFLNDKGEKVEMEVPRVEYVVVPEKID